MGIAATKKSSLDVKNVIFVTYLTFYVGHSSNTHHNNFIQDTDITTGYYYCCTLFRKLFSKTICCTTVDARRCSAAAPHTT